MPATSFDPRHEWQFFDDFLGGGTFGASPSEFDPWDITDTSAAGTPTYTRVDLGEDKLNVRFYVDEAAVATGTTFSMANHNTDSVDIDYVHLWGVR